MDPNSRCHSRAAWALSASLDAAVGSSTEMSSFQALQICHAYFANPDVLALEGMTWILSWYTGWVLLSLSFHAGTSFSMNPRVRSFLRSFT